MNLLTEDVMIREIAESLKKNLRRKSFHSSKVPIFIFVCGKQILGCEGEMEDNLADESNKRGCIIDGLKEVSLKRTIYSIVAEKLLSVELAQNDSLTFEGLLADMCDEIILIVEGEGTICELGAFAFSDKINKKVFVLNDQKYESANSFINRGPIKKMRGINPQNINYVDFDADWKELPTLQTHYNYITNIKRKYDVGKIDKEVYHINVKDIIIELLALVEIFHPITVEDIQQLYKFLRGRYKIETSVKIKNVNQVIDLLCEIGILQKDREFVKIEYNSFACASCVFTISENQINKTRAQILSRIRKRKRKMR